jgi:hypothetical protein
LRPQAQLDVLSSIRAIKSRVELRLHCGSFRGGALRDIGQGGTDVPLVPLDECDPSDLAFDDGGCIVHRGNATSPAHNREDLLEHRRKAMSDWAAVLSGADADNTVPLRRA